MRLGLTEAEELRVALGSLEICFLSQEPACAELRTPTRPTSLTSVSMRPHMLSRDSLLTVRRPVQLSIVGPVM